MGMTIHTCVDIRGALRRPKDFVGCMRADGHVIQTAEEMRKYLNYCLDQGWKVLPISDKCEGFSYQTGCPGHVTEE